MIKVSNDNNFIYSFLEKTEQLPVDFYSDKVLAFDSEDDFCIVFYVSINRNFICFTAANYLQDNNALICLMEVIQEDSTEQLSIKLINEALQLIEDKMYSKNNSRFYFDAH